MHVCVCVCVCVCVHAPRAHACMPASGRAGGRVCIFLELHAICRCRGPRTIKNCFAILSCATAVFLVFVCVFPCVVLYIRAHARTRELIHGGILTNPLPDARAHKQTYSLPSLALSRSHCASLS
jgi:hypothetical protein